MMFARNCMAAIVAMIVLLAVFAWMTGRAEVESIGILAVGLLIASVFCFVASLLIRLPFQRLRAALASLAAISLVMLGFLYALPLIDAYRQGYDVSKSLLHPIVFGSLGLAIVLLTQGRHTHL